MSDQKPLSEQVLEKLTAEQIEPNAKWHYQAQQLALWVFGFLFLVFGGLAFAVIIYMIRTNDWDIYHIYNQGFAVFFLSSLPYVWVALFVLLIAVIDYNIRQTEKGYHFKVVTISGVVLGSSIVLGGIFYAVGMGQSLNRVFSENVPYYNEIMFQKAVHWTNPVAGRLAGRIEKVVNDNQIMVSDLENTEWIIINVYDAEKYIQTVKPGVMIRVLGKMERDHVFFADVIMPFAPKEFLPPPQLNSERIKMHMRNR